MLLVIGLYLATIYIRPAEIMPGLAGAPIAQCAAAFAAAAGVVSYVLNPRPLFNRPTDRFLLGFWAAIVVSNLAWGWTGGAYKGLTDFFAVVFSYFIVRAGVRTDRDTKTIIGLLVAFTLFQAVNGILQHQTGAGFGDTKMVEDGRIRGTGIFNDPNDLGMVLIMVVPFVLSAIVDGAAWGRLIASAVLLPLLIAIYETNSRGAIVGLVAMLCVFLRSRFKGVIAPAVIAMALVAVVAAAPSRVAGMSSSEESAHGRIEAWSEGLIMFKTHPIFGVGYGRFTEFNELVAHNSFVHTFAELGFAGAFCLTGMWVSFFGGLKRSGSDSADPVRMRLRRDLIASAVGTLTCAMFLSRQYVIIPYLLLALGAAHASICRDEGLIERPSSGSLGTVLAATILGIVITRIVVLVLLHG